MTNWNERINQYNTELAEVNKASQQEQSRIEKENTEKLMGTVESLGIITSLEEIKNQFLGIGEITIKKYNYFFDLEESKYKNKSEGNHTVISVELTTHWNKYCPSKLEYGCTENSPDTYSDPYIGQRKHCISITTEMDDYRTTIEIKRESERIYNPFGIQDEKLEYFDIDQNDSDKNKKIIETCLIKAILDGKQLNIFPLTRFVKEDRKIILDAICNGELDLSELPKDWILTPEEKTSIDTRKKINTENNVIDQPKKRSFLDKLFG